MTDVDELLFYVVEGAVMPRGNSVAASSFNTLQRSTTRGASGYITSFSFPWSHPVIPRDFSLRSHRAFAI
jgi:hypothetical protein